MDIETYRQRKAKALAELTPKMRIRCPSCLQPDYSCYCQLIRPFDPNITFVILIHPIEVARRIATGRMAHLCLKNSHLISGHNFTNNSYVNQILNDQNLHSVMLYPGEKSSNLNFMTKEQKASLAPSGKKLAIFVMDGTWATAKKMVSLSKNLQTMPRICFTPSSPSNFKVRRQPKPECYSTIEAIHQTIDLLNPPDQKHELLLNVFDKVMARQLDLAFSKTIHPW